MATLSKKQQILGFASVTLSYEEDKTRTWRFDKTTLYFRRHVQRPGEPRLCNGQNASAISAGGAEENLRDRS